VEFLNVLQILAARAARGFQPIKKRESETARPEARRMFTSNLMRLCRS